MATHTRTMTVRLVTGSIVLLFLLCGILTWQAVGVDMSNPHANYWRFVRHGIPGFSTTPAQGHTILIQNGGENWREIRNAIIMRYAQWILILALAGIGIFYYLTGGDKLEKPRSGIKIQRYTLGERLLHWYTAALFITMALTGLSILLGRVALLPLFGHTIVAGWLGASKILHNYCGPLLLIGIALELVIWLRQNIPTKIDLQWFKNLGGMIGKGPRAHAGKVNGGQKAWFWLVVALGIVVGTTGVVLDFPVWGQTRFTMQVSHGIHVFFAVLFVAGSFAHIYMGTIGAEGAFEGMWRGSVDAVWAEQHADLWYAEQTQGKQDAPGFRETSP